MDRIELTADDEGKDVVGPDGQVLGRIERVEDGRAVVETEPATDDTNEILTGLGWANDAGETFPLESKQIADRSDDAVYLAEL